MYVVGIDIGGTFTDVIGLDTDTGEVSSHKTMTTPENFVEGVVRGIQALGVGLDQIRRIVHGTTLCTNALIEGEQARTGFITTKGFGDELDIQRMVRRWGKTSWSSIYDLHQRKPAPYVPRYLRMEIDERVTYPGTVIKELNAGEVRDAVTRLEAHGVDAVAVCFLWSFLYPEHERVAKRIIQKALPRAYVSVSSEVAPTFREYERMVTTAVNASLMPILSDYVARIEKELANEGFRGTLLLMQSHGGVGDPAVMKELPIYTLRGGPVGGAVAANHLGRLLGRKNVISCDIGGTSCDTSVILDHKIVILDETEVNYYPVRVPTADISCIGAGGGSIAYIDVAGALRVGPESAGASPGPACYGRGGQAPTLSDANLVLGRLHPEQLGGGMKLHRHLAHTSMESLASRLGWTNERIADAIVRISVANMAAAVRLQTIDRGRDPREFCLVAFGGAGPLHATLLAEATAISEVIVPREPGVFSTFGMVVSELAYYGQSGFLKPMAEVTPEELETEYLRLEKQGQDVLSQSNVKTKDMRFVRSAGMRYTMQEWELRVPVPHGTLTTEALERVGRSFHDAHRARHGFAKEDKPMEFVTLFLDSIGFAPPFEYPRAPSGSSDAGGAVRSRRRVYIDEESGAREVPVYDRSLLQAGNRLEGPAVIEERTSTTFVSPAWSGRVDEYGNLVLTRKR